MHLLELPTIRRRDEPALIEALLAEQQSLAAVERFARLHVAGPGTGPAQARYYRDLLPLGAPQPGEQYAFVVDLDSCSGCKACVTACHSLNGLDDDEAFRDVGLLTGRDRQGLHVLQYVTTACHHCLEPACLAGCPTRAYDKDSVTGIVRHLDDQCIGCHYCTLMCPYDVPKYNPAKGIVRKCDMCRQRLADGEAPACVQACPNQAIRIEVVARAAVQAAAAAGDFLADAPDPLLTLPTTRFVSKREPLRDVSAAGTMPDQPAAAHLPLVFMLVLTQMSVGMFCLAGVLELAGQPIAASQLAAAVIGLVGLHLAILHLGRPLVAYRAWLGWRTSWMSREIIAFGLFSASAFGLVVATLLPQMPLAAAARPWLSLATCLWGAIGVFCSAMIYVATRREFWSFSRTVPRFALTAGLLGAAGLLVVLALTREPVPPWLPAMLVSFTFVRLIADTSILKHRDDERPGSLGRSAGLLSGPLTHWNQLQSLAAMCGGALLPLLLLQSPHAAPLVGLLSAGLLVAAELIHRGLFFAAVAAPRMPGAGHP